LKILPHARDLKCVRGRARYRSRAVAIK